MISSGETQKASMSGLLQNGGFLHLRDVIDAVDDKMGAGAVTKYKVSSVICVLLLLLMPVHRITMQGALQPTKPE